VHERATRAAAPRVRLLQRFTAAPSEVIVHVSKDAQLIDVVAGGHSIPFMLATSIPKTIPEGSAVVSITRIGKVQYVRFAEQNTADDQLPSMPKVPFKQVEAQAQQTYVPKGASLSRFKVSATGGLFAQDPVSYQGFDAGSGDVHVQKHGSEFDLGKEDKSAYIQLAKEFGEAEGSYREALIGNTRIRVEFPYARDVTRVFVANGGKIRTFYRWNAEYSDPFAFAIWYTLNHNLKYKWQDVTQSQIAACTTAGVDLSAMKDEAGYDL
jgi:hypothetical protein